MGVDLVGLVAPMPRHGPPLFHHHVGVLQLGIGQVADLLEQEIPFLKSGVFEGL
jgi:hypothetical protein